MARLMDEKGTSEKGGGGRKASFKTKERKTAYVANRVSVPSNSVAELAAKLNTVVVEGRRGARGAQAGPTVRAAVLAFESRKEQSTKVLLVSRPKSPPALQPKPKRLPLPAHSKPNKVYTPEVTVSGKRLSLPKDSKTLEEALKPNRSFLHQRPEPEGREATEEIKEVEKTKEAAKEHSDREGYGKIARPPTAEKSSLYNQLTVEKSSLHKQPKVDKASLDNQPTVETSSLHRQPRVEKSSLHNQTKVEKSSLHNQPTVEKSSLHKPPSVERLQQQNPPTVGRPPQPNPAPRPSFLHRIPSTTAYEDVLPSEGTRSVAVGEEAPAPSKPDEAPATTKPGEVLPGVGRKSEEPRPITPEDEENNYEDMEEEEDHYAVINEYYCEDGNDYDDVGLKTESIYEPVDRHSSAGSDTSWEHRNSIYGIRPPSTSSNASGAVANGASRSDTSDEWVDVEMEDSAEEILVLREISTSRNRSNGNWSQIVRRQWSKRPYDVNNGDSDNDSGKIYEAIENLEDDSALCDDFSDSAESETYGENDYDKARKKKTNRSTSIPSEKIYKVMINAGQRCKKWSKPWFEKSIRRIQNKITPPQNPDERDTSTFSRKKQLKNKTRSVFYSDGPDLITSIEKKSPSPKPDLPIDPRRLSTAMRPNSPPPPPPPLRVNGDSKQTNGKSMNNHHNNNNNDQTTWYSEGLIFDQSTNGGDNRSIRSGTSVYSDGIYGNSKGTDTGSEHSSSQGSDINLRFADEPLYQFYAENVAQMERNEYERGSEYEFYEEIGSNGSSDYQDDTKLPSALDLVSPGIHRSLWCQVPQVVSSGILETLSPAQQRLQEAKFELITSEASYYKSLTVLDKHFASCPALKEETTLPKQEYKILFSNVNPVRKCSEAVLGALEKCWQDSIMLQGICSLIYNLSQECFQAYIKYCTNQVSIESTLKKIKQNNSRFVEAVTTLESSPKCQSLTLSSFLLLPMQRITRMPLLLDAILTRLEPDNPEYECCRLALAHLNKVALECNEAARRTERYEEMARLSNLLNFASPLKPLPLLSASRWLVRSGDVSQIYLEAKATFSRKIPSRKLKLYLFTDYLLITKKKSEEHYTVLDYCARNMVQMNMMEESIERQNTRFLVMLTLLQNHEGKTIEMVLSCGEESARERWLQVLATPSSSNPEETLYAEWDCPQVVALHPFTPSQPDELHLQKGDVVNVLRKLHDGWYHGERIRDGEKGWFPGNYSQEIASTHVKAKNLKLRYRLLALSANFLQQQQKKQTPN